MGPKLYGYVLIGMNLGMGLVFGCGKLILPMIGHRAFCLILAFCNLIGLYCVYLLRTGLKPPERKSADQLLPDKSGVPLPEITNSSQTHP